jgi:(E)-4-hydroxy-3-methylbut-2-enyl-diphosphate synthase
MEFLRICRRENFDNVVVSIKTRNTPVMVTTVRLLNSVMASEGIAYPLHLGVTEAGDAEDGRIKSAVGIGALLADGIGDTVRVSLAEAPENEIPVAKELVDYISSRAGHAAIDGVAMDSFDYINPKRRESIVVAGVGGGGAPVVVSVPFEGASGDLAPDFIVDGTQLVRGGEAYPVVSADSISIVADKTPFFLKLQYGELNDELLSSIKACENCIIVAESNHVNPVAEIRALVHRLSVSGVNAPVIVRRCYEEKSIEALRIKAAADFGVLLIDGLVDGVWIESPAISAEEINNLAFGILQATRLRISKTEYIACPGCGRTMYDLQGTLAKIKAATAHLKGLKIGVMGCIVNGPGEMADADFGYVGEGKGKVCIYKGKEPVLRSVPQEEAIDKLLQVIEENLK